MQLKGNSSTLHYINRFIEDSIRIFSSNIFDINTPLTGCNNNWALESHQDNMYTGRKEN